MATPDELDKMIADLHIEIPLNPETSEKRSFRSFQEFRQFFDSEVAFWNGVNIGETRQPFQGIASFLAQAQADPANSRNYINQAVNAIRNAGGRLIYSHTAPG